MGINDIFVRYLAKTDACLRSILDVFVTVGTTLVTENSMTLNQ